MRPDDDEIDRLGDRGLHDRFAGIAFPDQTADRHAFTVAAVDDPLGGRLAAGPDLVHALSIADTRQPLAAGIDDADQQERAAEPGR